MNIFNKITTMICIASTVFAGFAQEMPVAEVVKTEETVKTEQLPEPSVSDVIQMIGKDAKIDWTLFQFRATGIGIAPASATGARAKALAREAAIVIAERNLLKVVQGVHISSDTTVENLVLSSDVIKTKVEGLLKGAPVVSEKDLNNGTYLVVVALPLLGENKLADTIDLPKQVDEVLPDDKAVITELPAPKLLKGDFTGLLIDCRGMKLSPAMTPVIYGPDDDAVYPRDEYSNDIIVSKGIAAYYKSIDAAKKSGRVGGKPLVIKASGIKKDGDDMWYTSPILSQADTARVLAEDNRSNFMSKLAVGFLVD